MGLFDKIKGFINASEEGYLEDIDENESVAYVPESYEEEAHSGSASFSQAKNERDSGKVVDIRSSSRPHVVFKKLDRFQDVGAVADVLNEKRIVILNLETCPSDVSQRIIDFLFGVAYANSGEIKRVAGRAYVITPYNVAVTGELLDELENSGFSGAVFE